LIKEFLLHKDKKENKEIAIAQMAHLVLLDTQADLRQNQKSHFFVNAPKPTHHPTGST
jgi:hypothetical protein